MPRGIPGSGKAAKDRPRLVDNPDEAPEKLSPQVDSPQKPAEGFPTPKDEQSGVERISFKIVDGKLDVTSLRPSTAGRAKEVMERSLTDGEFRKYFGLETQPQTIPQIVSPVIIGGALDLIAYLETAALTKKTGLPREEVSRIVSWTPDEHLKLDRQGADLANKYIPPEWLKYADLTLFCTTMIMIVRIKANAVERHAKNRLEAIGRAPSHDERETEPPPKAPAPAAPPPASPSNGASASVPSNLLTEKLPPDAGSRSLE